MQIPEFTRYDEEAEFRVNLKRELRKRGVFFFNNEKTEDLLEKVEGLK